MSVAPLRKRSESAVSGARRRAGIAYAIASMKTGSLTENPTLSVAEEQLTALAATIPALFDGTETATLGRLWEQLGSDEGRSTFQDVVVLSEEYVYVIQPLAARPGFALLAASPSTNVGMVLSEVRARVAELERG